jgi:hypothetical protein
MARPAPADFKTPESQGDPAKSPGIEDGKSPFAYDRRLADSSRSGIPARVSEHEALQNFETEQKRNRAPSGTRRNWVWITAIGLCVLVGAGLAVAGVLWTRTHTNTIDPPPVTSSTGTANINSRPEGAAVTVDGQARGVTPLKLSLPVGQHSVEITNGSDARTIPLTIESGSIVSHYIDLAPEAAAAERLDVSSDPPGAQLFVDGKGHGVTPASIAGLGAGQHEVLIVSGDTRVKRTVLLTKGATSSVFASLSPAGSSAGWLSIKAPIDLQILENGKVIGMTSADQIMVPAGHHDLALVNAALGFQTTISVQVAPGKTVSSAVALPNGSVSINAVPWAEVWLDGTSLGTTPLANVAVPIGNHEVVLRHPQLGERRQNVVVTSKAPVRIGVEFTK